VATKSKMDGLDYGFDDGEEEDRDGEV